MWRDFARQFGSLVMDRALYQRLTGDDRLTDLALWLAPGAVPGSSPRTSTGTSRRAARRSPSEGRTKILVIVERWEPKGN